METEETKKFKKKFQEQTKNLKEQALEIMNIKLVEKFFALSEKVISIPKYNVDLGEKGYKQVREYFVNYSKDLENKKKKKRFNKNGKNKKKQNNKKIEIENNNKETKIENENEKEKQGNLATEVEQEEKENDKVEHKNNEKEIKKVAMGLLKLENEHNLIGCNTDVLSLMTDLKKEVLVLVDYTSKAKRWMRLTVPKISDGGNFGVEVIEEVMNVLERSEDVGFEVIDSMTKYFVARGKLISKTIKHPSIEDYSRSVFELDESQKISLRTMFSDIRDNYGVMYDVIQKNIEKILKPRNENTISMF
ncbi:proteasome regulator pa28 [Anaeramoeba flamelloides]|uniref:Proteasome regulator pa28 n=1 Tax=Anaeramoeba flamelloides TaxID=1746091 RepID=A0ABQ8YN43_9EUKA|nr:proteasome regulator pa28 [Anaeramoeba flamelloides]